MSNDPAPYRLNTPPDTFIRVPYRALEAFITQAGLAVGMPATRAELLADLLTANDLRGVFSHGTRLMATYATLLRGGRLNPTPEPHVVRETPSSVVVDGDGGLGYFAMHLGTRLAIAKAASQGMAVMQSRNHGHIGAAGLYARMTLAHDLLTFVTSGHQLDLAQGMPVYSPAIGSPMSFSAPAGSADPLVLDFSPVYDLRISPYWSEIAAWVPGTVFRCIGLGTVAQAWGGLLAGIPVDGSRAARRFPEANQAALLVTFQIGLFVNPDDFRREMDELARRVASLAPLPGFTRAQLAGGPEAERDRAWRVEGVPIGPDHQRDLERLAAELGLAVPWR
ncbi:MAG: Ldh family oxidoreductase [Actinobacteria bacterium]|nr:Ldh family oxidoreductase [Actinomycetota bacterium]